MTVNIVISSITIIVGSNTTRFHFINIFNV